MQASGGNIVATGVSSVTTSTTKTYYVSCTNASGCESGRTAVTATVNICTVFIQLQQTAMDLTQEQYNSCKSLSCYQDNQGSNHCINATPGVFSIIQRSQHLLPALVYI